MQVRVRENPKIEIIMNTSITKVLGEQKVEGVELVVSHQPSAVSRLKLDGVFIAIGHKPDTAVFKDTILLDKKGYIVTSAVAALDIAKNIPRPDGVMFDYTYQSMTSVPGVFAAGDCVDHTYRQAGTAAGMGIASALDIERWIEKKEVI